MEPVRYGIIGLGRMATRGHLPALRTVAEAKIVAVADVNADALQSATTDLPEAAAYMDYHELLEDPNVEAVVVATPNGFHAEQAVAALDAGRHVLCEKPLGIDLTECEAILAAQDRSGKLLQVGHELRYATVFQAAKEKLDAGLIGRIQMMLFHEFRGPLVPGWRQTAETGGIMLEKNSHFFDLFNWFAQSEPARIGAMGGNSVNHDSPLPDHCTVSVEYGNGVRATLLMCLFCEHGSRPMLDLIGDKGRLVAYADDRRLVHYSRDSAEPMEWTFNAASDDATCHSGIAAQHRAFIRCIREGEPVLVDGASAHCTLRIALAAEEALRESRLVELPQ